MTSGGALDVVLDYACTSGEADKPFLLEVAGQTIQGPVASTGLWDRYSQATVGRIKLEPGDHHLTFRAGGPITGPLINLRAIRLVLAVDEEQ